MVPRNVIIDCDTGVDDAEAILLALRSPELNVLGITTVAGNVSIEKVVRNTLVVVEHSGKQVPVYQGVSRALLGSGERAESVHGSNGLGDIAFPEPKIHKQREHAVDFLVTTFMETSQPVHLVTLAPLTNIALALQIEPRIADRLASLVMMAGGIDNGNTTVMGEFNVYADPEAADLVFRSCIPNKTMVALDPNFKSGGIYPEDVDRLAASNTPWCSMISTLLRGQIERWSKMAGFARPASPPDMTAMGVAIDPTLAEAELLPVVVETSGRYTRGMTVVDRRPFRGVFRQADEPNVNVVWTLDNARYRKLVLDTLLAE